MAAESPNDKVLLGEIQKGSSSASASLVRKHGRRYYGLAYRYTASREDAEDIVQTAFVKLWENPNVWDPGKGVRFTTWFYRIVVNLCLDRKKKHREIAIPESFEAADENRSQEKEVCESEENKLLAEAIAALPSRQKAALILCFYEGLSNEDAAKTMSISVKALQSLLMRAKTVLRRDMQRYLWKA